MSKKPMTDEHKRALSEARKARTKNNEEKEHFTVHVINDLYVDADDYNFILARRSPIPSPVTGEYSYKTLGYFTTVESLLMAVLNRSDLNTVIKSSTYTELSDLLCLMRESRLEIRETIGKALG